MSIGDLAREAGVSTATIHFYVKEGVLPPPRRLNRTRAAWSAHHLRLLRVVSRLKANGLPLAVIARMMKEAAESPDALERIEGIGYFQPLPATRGSGGPIEPFEPVSRAEILEKAGVAEAVLDAAEAAGLVRAKAAGRYDARDLWALRQVAVLLGDGVPLGPLGALTSMATLARGVAPLVFQQAEHRQDAVRSRELRFRDLLEPWENLTGYVLDRVMEEMRPGWREQLFGYAEPKE